MAITIILISFRTSIQPLLSDLRNSETEMQRLNIIHWAMRELWQTSVRVPLAHPAVKILDVGCGSGIWSKEIAEVLPRAQVIGVDLSPPFLPEEPGLRFPENLSFEVWALYHKSVNFNH